MNKTKLDSKRDGSLSCEMPLDCGAILELLTLNDCLYIVGEKSIYQARLPDNIDPERENPNAKGSTHKFFSKGMNDSVVSRTLGQALELTRKVGMSQEEGDQILVFSLRFMRNFHEIILAYESLDKDFNEKADEFNKIKKQHIKSDFIHDIPQIERLDARGDHFFLTLHKCLKIILEMLNSTLPKSESPKSFDKLYKYYKDQDENSVISQLLENSLETLSFMWNIRNSVEHPGKTRFVKYYNLELQKDGRISDLGWEYAYENFDKKIIESSERFSLLGDMNVSIANILAIFEDTILAISLKKLPDVPLTPCTIINEDDNYPFRYSIKYISNPDGVSQIAHVCSDGILKK